MAGPSDDLFARAALPDEIAVLRTRFPRPTWEDHANLGPLARFWLERHDMFRALGAALAEGAETVRSGRTDPQDFAGWYAPRVRLYLGELHSHHAVEDHHYFPVFRAADARLARGFEILDRDHHVIDTLIHALAASSNDLFAAVRGRGGEPERAAEALCRDLSRSMGAIGRHLEDEEDLVVPLILDRTEGGLGLA